MQFRHFFCFQLWLPTLVSIGHTHFGQLGLSLIVKYFCFKTISIHLGRISCKDFRFFSLCHYELSFSKKKIFAPQSLVTILEMGNLYRSRRNKLVEWFNCCQRLLFIQILYILILVVFVWGILFIFLKFDQILINFLLIYSKEWIYCISKTKYSLE